MQPVTAGDRRDPTRGVDPSIALAVLVGLALRGGLLWIWPSIECVRDECIYRYLATGILDNGSLGKATKGWLAAPGYPYLLAELKLWTGGWQAVKWIQVLVSGTSIPVMAALARRVAPERPTAAGRWAAWMFALHPTLAWYTNTLWIETIFIGLLLPAALAVLVARDGRRPLAFAALAGLLLGVCILFRGVATWLPPIFALALVWPDAERWSDALRRRAPSAAAMLAAAALTVAPYSLSASKRYGGFMVSDATAGHVLFLGNNDFQPMTFDYGIGALTQPLYYRNLRLGRRMCDRKQSPVLSSRCDTEAAIAWARENPGEFTRRIPLRLAQQLNPNTFFTRHLRWGYFPGLPWQLEELLVVLTAGMSALVVLGGTLAGIARGRGAWAVLAGGTIAYVMLTAAVSYGMSRFRLPLEPLWMVWLAALFAEPRATWSALRGSPPRLVAAALLLPGAAWLMSWFALTGFPMFWR